MPGRIGEFLLLAEFAGSFDREKSAEIDTVFETSIGLKYVPSKKKKKREKRSILLPHRESCVIG